MSKLIDLTGKRFGKLTVLYRHDDYICISGSHQTQWKCKCDCGADLIVKSHDLISGKKSSCGCGKLENLIKNSIGKKYGRLTCIDYAYKVEHNGHFFKFKCDCGNTVICNLSRVRNGYTKSCGCLKKENARKAVFKDLTGMKFNYLTVLEYSRQKNGRTMWKCKCDCGNEVEVDSRSLKSGNTTACGCRQSVGWTNSLTHGKSKTRIYSIWQGMKARCNNPKEKYYENYGGRGIKVCEEWEDSFEKFDEWATNNGYADNLTIDRIDNNGNYEPNNCKWSTRTEQMNNTRSNNVIEYKGKRQTLAEWARELGVPYYILNGRLNNRKWSIERAFETPVLRR